MNRTLRQVHEFHETFTILPTATIAKEPKVLSFDELKFRADFIKEELNELVEACAKDDLIGVLDAFADIQYVLNGAILQSGLHHVFDAAHDEVHMSNMTKACKSYEEALQTIQKYEVDDEYIANGWKCDYTEDNNGRFIVFRQHDRKLLKSINYSKADLKAILNGTNKGIKESEQEHYYNEC